MEYDDTCIICLEDILKDDAIWSCVTCYCEFHLVCINNWISQYRQSKQKLLTEEQDSLNLSEGYNNAHNRLNKLINDVDHWSCPKCRHDYDEAAPNRYLCYCGKTSEPKNNHWLNPHTCGEKCGKFLKPYCGDICLELCHRGSCSPCPKMLKNIKCYCGKHNEAAIRCSQRFLSCGEICGKILSCNIHICQKTCHANCGFCDEMIIKECVCGSNSKSVRCSEEWQCSENCKKADESLLNKCPCGKMSLETVNSGDGYRQITCQDSCEKLLDCGIHKCTDKCHVGNCSNCRKMISKSCRCGATVAMMPCHKKLTCNTKCVRWKNCNKHQCKRRCCDPVAGCAPCDLICNAFLNCRKHRCQMRCHLGPCYPCRQTVDVTCSCASSTKRVLCGTDVEKIRKNLIKSCSNMCNITSKCRHQNQHKCHSKDMECPPCKEVCGNILNCAHKCQNVCHDSVKITVRLDKSKLAGPWEATEDGKIKFIPLPCPPCQVQLSLICFGSHQQIAYECSRPLKYASCGKECGRLLKCGNHGCSLECHPISDQKCPEVLIGNNVQNIDASRFCEESCNKLCTKPFQKNPCKHPCSKITCHKGACPPCTRFVIHKCYCGALTKHIECYWGQNPPPEQLSCPSRCPRMLTKSCGHQCPRNCHPGECADIAIQCKAKVTGKCSCGQKKFSIPCWKVVDTEFQCDPVKCNLNDLEVRKRKKVSGNGLLDENLSVQKASLSTFINWRAFVIFTSLTFICFVIGCFVYIS